jgi:hypothetical protein
LSVLTKTQQSSILVEMRDEAREEKDMKHVEGLKLLLQPSAAPQDRLDEIKREQVPGKLIRWACACAQYITLMVA